MARKKRKPTYVKDEENNKIYLPNLKNFSARNKNQAELLKAINTKDITIVKGIAGSGKTYVALAAALGLLGDTYKQIVLVKSLTVVPNEELGFLKGSLQDKLDPYMMSFTWNIDKLCGEGASKYLTDSGLLKVIPIAFMRGLSIDNSIVVLDESQNFSMSTFKTLISRMGSDCKYIFMGDTEQIDMKNKSESSLDIVYNLFKDNDNVGTIEFSDEDCVRNPLIPEILKTLRDNSF